MIVPFKIMNGEREENLRNLRRELSEIRRALKNKSANEEHETIKRGVAREK